MIGIYRILNPNGKSYIGQSVDIESRWNKYKKYPHDIKNQTKIYNSILKHGIENHRFEILEECTVDRLNILERKYQDLFNSVAKGLNCKATSLDEKSGYLSEETKTKISIANKGREFSPEWKTRISKALKGRKKPVEVENKRLISRQGYIHTEVTLEKIRLSNKSVPSIICPHCGKEGKPHGMKRWHFDSCKSKV